MSGLRFQWIAATLFWTFIAALIGLQIWTVAQQPGETFQVRRALVWQTGYYLAWIPFTVPLWQAVARLPLDGWSRWRVVGAHVLLCAAVAVPHALIVVGVGMVLSPTPGESTAAIVLGQIRGRVYTHVVIYAGIIASGYAFVMYERWREQAQRAARLEGQLAEATLSALRAQLHPHLLFNSLHAVASLVRESRNPEAVKLIADMGELLRRVMDTEKVWHHLDEELALVNTYLDVQRVRFEDRLTTTVEIAAGVGEALVPVLVLQPLVENSLRHGFAGKVGVGHLTVRAWRDGELLRLEVEDDGVPGPQAAPDAATGTGLANLQARLTTLYEGHASLRAGARVTGGYLVSITLPWRIA